MARKGTRRTSAAPSAPPALIRAQPTQATASDLMPLLAPAVLSSSRAPAAVSGTSVAAPAAAPSVTAEQRRRLIAQAAFERAQRHGLGTTDPFADWLHAEREVDARLGSSV